MTEELSGTAIMMKQQAEQAYFRALREHWEKQIWNEAIEYIIPIATADYHITAEELRRYKK